MRITYAFRGNIASIVQSQNDYLTNLVYVITYVHNVISSRPTAPDRLSPAWKEFLTTYKIASADVLRWVNSVLTKLLNIPPGIQDYATLVDTSLRKAKSHATDLAVSPTNQATSNLLHDELNNLLRIINLMVTFLNGRLESVQCFSEVFPRLAQHLQTAASEAHREANCDRQQLANFIKQVNQTQTDIDHLTAAIIDLGIANTCPLTMASVVIANAPSQHVSWLNFGSVLAFATTYIGLDAENIQKDKNAIEETQNAMDPITLEVAMMNALSDIFTNLTVQCAQLEQNLEELLISWQTLESEITFAIQDIQSSIANASKSSRNLHALEKDFEEAIEEWTNVVNQSSLFSLTIQVNDVKLHCSMSQEKIIEDMAHGRTFDIVTYLNRIGDFAQVA